MAIGDERRRRRAFEPPNALRRGEEVWLLLTIHGEGPVPAKEFGLLLLELGRYTQETSGATLELEAVANGSLIGFFKLKDIVDVATVAGLVVSIAGLFTGGQQYSPLCSSLAAIVVSAPDRVVTCETPDGTTLIVDAVKGKAKAKLLKPAIGHSSPKAGRGRVIGIFDYLDGVPVLYASYDDGVLMSGGPLELRGMFHAPERGHQVVITGVFVTKEAEQPYIIVQDIGMGPSEDGKAR